MLATRFRHSAVGVLRNVSGLCASGPTEWSNNRSFQPPPGHRFESRRSLFSDDVLGLDSYIQTTQKVRLSTPDPEGFKKSMSQLFQKSGLQSIFNDDLVKLISLAEADEDFELVKNILVGCLWYLQEVQN